MEEDPRREEREGSSRGRGCLGWRGVDGISRRSRVPAWLTQRHRWGGMDASACPMFTVILFLLIQSRRCTFWRSDRGRGLLKVAQLTDSRSGTRT